LMRANATHLPAQVPETDLIPEVAVGVWQNDDAQVARAGEEAYTMPEVAAFLGRSFWLRRAATPARRSTASSWLGGTRRQPPTVAAGSCRLLAGPQRGAPSAQAWGAGGSPG
jgi:hypothetical protein